MADHGGKLGDVSIYGQESNPTTWRLAAMNLAIRDIDFNLGREPADSFVRGQHPDLRADFVLANPPFNVSDWWHGSLEGVLPAAAAVRSDQPSAVRTGARRVGRRELLARTIAAAAGMKALAPAEFDSVIVDTTVQEKAIAFPTDSRLLEVTRAKPMKVA